MFLRPLCAQEPAQACFCSGRSKWLFERVEVMVRSNTTRACLRSQWSVELAARACLRWHWALESASFKKTLRSDPLCSFPLGSVPLGNVHGYARVRTSIYIYIYIRFLSMAHVNKIIVTLGCYPWPVLIKYLGPEVVTHGPF